MNAMQYAAEMESEGINYYTSQIQEFKGTTLERIFSILAEDEARHLAVIHAIEKNEPVRLPENSNLIREQNVFSGLEKFEDEIRANPPQVAIYEMALSLEEKSARLYQECIDQSVGDSERDIFAFLLEQEKLHIEIFEELITRIRRVDEWVESAEFGNREEY